MRRSLAGFRLRLRPFFGRTAGNHQLVRDAAPLQLGRCLDQVDQSLARAEHAGEEDGGEFMLRRRHGRVGGGIDAIVDEDHACRAQRAGEEFATGVRYGQHAAGGGEGEPHQQPSQRRPQPEVDAPAVRVNDHARAGDARHQRQETRPEHRWQWDERGVDVDDIGLSGRPPQPRGISQGTAEVGPCEAAAAQHLIAIEIEE